MLDDSRVLAPPKPDRALLARFTAIVGEKNAITDPDRQAPYLVEFRALWTGHTPVVLRPGSTAEVSRNSQDRQRDRRPRSCRRAAIPAWSAGKFRTTARWCCRCNGSTRSARSIRSPTPSPARPASRCSAPARPPPTVDRLYPQFLPSEGSCTIGGNLSTNAGGTAALAYGIARSHALGLEVVLADGRIMQQPQQAEEGQHRLRSARPVHRRRRHARRHHRGGAAAGAAAEVGRDRLGVRSPRCRRRSIFWGSPPSVPPAA